MSLKLHQFIAATLLSCVTGLVLAGAWDVGPFDNDDALDWVWELSESDDLSVVEDALQNANNASGYVEAPTGSIAIAAAEVVAALKGKPAAQLPEEVSDWVERHRFNADERLVLAARKAVLRVQDTDSSELAQLWSDSEEAMVEWRRYLSDLESRLK